MASALESLAFDFTVITFQYRRGTEVGAPCLLAVYNPNGTFDPYGFLNP